MSNVGHTAANQANVGISNQGGFMTTVHIDYQYQVSNVYSPFEWMPEQLSRFLTNPTPAKLLEHPGQ